LIEAPINRTRDHLAATKRKPKQSVPEQNLDPPYPA
jgi:hypothetical protein